MFLLASLLATMWLSTAAVNIIQVVTSDASAIYTPVAETIATVGSSQCQNVQKIAGVEYDDYNGDPPDLSKLTLQFKSRSANITYNLTTAAEDIAQSQWFDPKKPLMIYLHGFIDNPNMTSFRTICNAVLSKGDYNILALDASPMTRWFYARAVILIQIIGEALARLCVALNRLSGLASSLIHLIGHSLGGHMAGFAGKFFLNQTGSCVGRITALDPAGPCLSQVNQSHRLHKTDADFVDVIHTDEGVYGINQKVGHVDFYPNGGSEQPNCLFHTCSHSRAWEYFAESLLNETAFPGVQCASWKDFREGLANYSDTSLMGYNCTPGTTGSYYLQTSGESLYGRGVKGETYENNVGIVKNIFNVYT